MTPAGLMYVEQQSGPSPSNPLTSTVHSYRSGNVTLADFVWIKINLNAKVFDTNDDFDEVTNYRFVAPETGYYYIAGQTEILETASGQERGQHQAAIRVNGTAVAVRWAVSGSALSSTATVGVQDLVFLNATDYVELWVLANFVVQSTLVGQSSGTFLSVVGPYDSDVNYLARGYIGSAQSVSSSSWTYMNYSHENFDVGGGFSSNRFNVGEDGDYWSTWQMSWNIPPDDQRETYAEEHRSGVSTLKATSSHREYHADERWPQGLSACGLMDAVDGDWFRSRLFINASGASTPMRTGSINSYMSTFGPFAVGARMRAYSTTGSVTPGTSWRKVPIDTTDVDAGSHLDDTNNRFVATQAGVYLIAGMMHGRQSTSFKSLEVSIYKNGSEYLYGKNRTEQSYPRWDGIGTVGLVELAETDYLELWTRNSGGNLLESQGFTYLQVLGPF
jgi:hypothetical protein